MYIIINEMNEMSDNAIPLVFDGIQPPEGEALPLALRVPLHGDADKGGGRQAHSRDR